MHKFELVFTKFANEDLVKLQNDRTNTKRLKAIYKALAYLQANPRHPSLNTHKYLGIKGVNSEDVFEAYAENNTSGAYRIFWHYGVNKNQITVIAIVPHP